MESDAEEDDGNRDDIDFGDGNLAKINLNLPILEFKRLAWIALLSFGMEKGKKVTGMFGHLIAALTEYDHFNPANPKSLIIRKVFLPCFSNMHQNEIPAYAEFMDQQTDYKLTFGI